MYEFGESEVRTIGPRQPGSEVRPRKALRYVRDLEWKLLSLMLAAGLWSVAKYELMQQASVQSSTRTWEQVPIMLLIRPNQLACYRVEPDRVKLTVRGDSQVLNQLSLEQIVSWVDAARVDNADLAWMPVKVFLPQGCKVVAIEPEQVKVCRDDEKDMSCETGELSLEFQFSATNR